MTNLSDKSWKMETKYYFMLWILLIAALGMLGASCEGPAGPQRSQGPVGPAGEDGSVIYAGTGAPTGDIGSAGDYYLDQTTGGLYGPKNAESWGDPILVLMGEDGQAGENGQDGSQIYADNGTPAASLGKTGDYYLDKSSYELYGPKTSAGWGTPINLKGADGNANVTRYIFPGHDFSSVDNVQKLIYGVENGDESLWLVYLYDGQWKYFVPGYGPDGFTQYRQKHGIGGSVFDVRIRVASGPGESFSNIYVVQIEATNTVDMTSSTGGHTLIPSHLDISNYEDVAEYYGFSSKVQE